MFRIGLKWYNLLLCSWDNRYASCLCALMLLTNSVEHSASWEAKSHSSSQEILCLFWDSKGSLPCSQELATGPWCVQSTHSHRFPVIHTNSILPPMPRFFWAVLSLQVFWLKFYMHFFFTCCAVMFVISSCWLMLRVLC